MDIRRIELMKQLQREYYGELRKKKWGRSQEIFVYRLFIVLLLGILTGILFF